MIKAVTSAPPSSSQSSDSGTTDVTSNGTFGALLARQVQEKAAADPSAAQVKTVQTDANQAEAIVAPDVAIPPASITIASLGKKDLKLPATRVSDTKIKSDPATLMPDANTLNIVNPGILPMAISQVPVQAAGVTGSAKSTPVVSGISSAMAGKLADSASSLTNPKLVPENPASVDPKLAPNTVPGAAADAKTSGLTASADVLAAKPDANPSDARTASLQADFSRVLQDATGAPQSKPSPDAMQGAQLAAVQSMMNARMPFDPAAHVIAAPLNSPAWAGEFSQKVTWLSHEQSQVAELHLNPPDLGPMHVVISVTDNQAMAQFSSPHSEVRHAIENALPKLRESLADNGIMLGNATVSDQTPRDSGAGQFMQQRSRTGNAVSPEHQATIMPATPIRRHTGMLDTFA